MKIYIKDSIDVKEARYVVLKYVFEEKKNFVSWLLADQSSQLKLCRQNPQDRFYTVDKLIK